MKKFLCAVGLCAIAVSAQASPISYDGVINPGSPVTGSVAPGNNTGNPGGWDYWSFFADAGDLVSVDGDRLEGGLDPIIGVFSGLFADTAALPSSSICGGVACGDDDTAPFLPGPWGDPLFSFSAGATGWYTLAVASFASSGDTGQDGVYDYRVTVNGQNQVPEPAALGLIGLGLAGLAMARRRKA